MRINFRTPPVRMSAIWLTLIGFVVLLCITSCATPPRLIAVECPKFPVRPATPALDQITVGALTLCGEQILTQASPSALCTSLGTPR